MTPLRARRIGLELGCFLLLAAGVLAVRGARPAAVAAAGALGATLAVLAIMRPGVLVPFAQKWMSLAFAISRVTSPILLTVIYLGVFTPMAWMRRTFGRTPIARDVNAATYWRRRDVVTPDAARRAMERPF